MDEAKLQAIAQQLRQPLGEDGKQVGVKMNDGNRHINLSTIEALDVTSGDHILEIGMGNGFFVKDIVTVSPSVKYAGCDYSADMVEEASKLNGRYINGGQVQFYHSDADNLPFEAASFHKIFTINTIYFWNDPKKVLSEVRRVLKPQGLFFIALRPKATMNLYPFVKYGFKLFDKNDVAALLKENGFTVVDILEKQEPEQEINGKKFDVGTLIVKAQK